VLALNESAWNYLRGLLKFHPGCRDEILARWVWISNHNLQHSARTHSSLTHSITHSLTSHSLTHFTLSHSHSLLHSLAHSHWILTLSLTEYSLRSLSCLLTLSLSYSLN
jgi:hypothetical protein